MKKTKSFLVAVVSDPHVGSKIGLAPPRIDFDDGDSYEASQIQQEAWDYWKKDFWPFVWKKNRETVVVFNGDLIDGNHHGTNQIWSASEIEQIRVAADLFDPIARKASSTYVVRGTPAHVMASGMADEAIARKIRANKSSPEGNRVATSSYHLKLNVGGVNLDIAHHGPNPGRRIWLYGNELRGYCRTIVLDALARNAKPPDAIIRSHVHHKVHETVRDYGNKCEAFITPAWQWKTEFAHRIVSHEDIADIGGLLIEIDGSEISNAYFRILPMSQSDFIEIK